MKHLNAVLCTFIFLMAITLNMTPEAYKILNLRAEKNQVQNQAKNPANFYISDTHYVCPGGYHFLLVQEGAPEELDDYEAVEYQEIVIYVPNEYTDEVTITDFKRTNGMPDVGVQLPQAY